MTTSTLDSVKDKTVGAMDFVKEHPKSAGLPIIGGIVAAIASLVWWGAHKKR